MNHFSKHNNADSDAKGLAQFVRLVKSEADTPTLLRRIAADHQYLMFCAAAVKADQNKSPHLMRLRQILRDQLRHQGISLEQFRKKLQPIAFALGLGSLESALIQEDYYKILGVSFDADQEAIKKAYRDAARLMHPDVNPGKEDAFINVQNAYETLSDHTLRRQYDISRSQSMGSWHEGSGNREGKKQLPKRFYWRYGIALAGIILVLFFITIWIDHNSRNSVLTNEYAVAIDKAQEKSRKSVPLQESGGQTASSLDLQKKTITLAPDVTNSPANGLSKNRGKSPQTEKSPFIQEETPAGEADNHVSPAKIIPFNALNSGFNKGEQTIVKVSAPLSMPKDPLLRNSYDSAQTMEIKTIETKTPMVSASLKSGKKPAGPAALPAREGNKTEKSAEGTFTPFNPENMKKQLSRFAEKYCQVYSSKDLNGFMNFFTETATENGRPIKTLFPKYEETFKSINLISYKVKFSNYQCDLSKKRVIAKGSFNLMWVKRGTTNWNHSEGRIQMDLIPDDISYRIERFSYQFVETK